MPRNTNFRFDHNRNCYRHGCCHIQTAALTIGILQLVCFMYELTDLTVVQRHVRVTSNQRVANNEDVDFLNNLRNNDDTYKKGYNTDFYSMSLSPVHVKKPWAYAADVAWNGMVAFAIILMFYAAKWNRPYLITPKLVFDAIAAGIMTVSAATILILSSGTSYAGPRTYEYALYSIFLATINCYIFTVTWKYFKYLLQKRAFLDGTFNGVFVLPFATHGVRMTDAEIWNHLELPAYGAAVHSDVPPAYPGVAIPKNNATSAPPGASFSTNNNAQSEGDVSNQLPTYDEAQKLRENNQKKEVV